jgi:hypothetical protein
LTALEVLDLQANALGSAVAAVAAGLRGLGGLREVYLQYNEATDQGGTAVAEALGGLTRLEVCVFVFI